MRALMAKLRPAALPLVTLLGVAACGGTHAGVVPTTRLLRTSLSDDGSTVTRLAKAARAQGCALHGVAEPTTRLFATCDDVGVLFASGPWAGQLSVQCTETRAEAECGALAERIASAAMQPPSGTATLPASAGPEGAAGAQPEPGSAGDAR